MSSSSSASSSSTTGSKDKRSSEEKAEDRRQRNLASAYASRSRKRETIAHLEAEKARLNEANAMLRTRLNLEPTQTLPAASPIGHRSHNGTGHMETGPGLRKITKKQVMKDEAAVDLLDRVLTGSRGKGTPVDPALVQKWVRGLKTTPNDPTKKPVVPALPSTSHYKGQKKKTTSSKKR